MNAFNDNLSAAVVDQLLFAGFQMTDSLVLDLYGTPADLSVDPDDEDGGHIVTGVTVSGSKADISELFTGAQLDAMSVWLDYKDAPNDSHRRLAERNRIEATRPPYSRNRGLN